MIAAVVVVYLALVALVGLAGRRLFQGTGEDYFVAGRTIGPAVLLLTLVGTNMTAFTMLGLSGEAYNRGAAVFAFVGSSSAILVPFIFYYLGTRCWWLGKRYGYVTQVQLIRDRYGSGALGTLLFAVTVLLMLPYILIGVKGGGDALNAITGGAAGGIPPWVGSLAVCAVTFLYVIYGGMRSTSWANAFQTAVFMTVSAAAFFVILNEFGGVEAAMRSLRERHRELVVFGTDSHSRLLLLSYFFIPLCTGAFPHLYAHWLSARRAGAFRTVLVFYPLCFLAVNFPIVILGMTGRLAFEPPLDGPILVKLIVGYTGGLLAGCLAAGVFAAIMSSLDSQSLALGAMFTEDIVRHYGFDEQLTEQRQVLFGRVFAALFLGSAFVCSLLVDQSIFALGSWSLTGFAGLLPMFAAALYWRRSSKAGAAAAVVTAAGLWIYFFADSLGAEGAYSIGGTGLLPIAVIVPASAAAVLFVSLLTRPPADAARFFPED